MVPGLLSLHAQSHTHLLVVLEMMEKLHLPGCMLLSSGAESTSHGSKYQAHQDSFELDFKIKLNDHSLLLFGQIISLSLHGPINSYTVVFFS